VEIRDLTPGEYGCVYIPWLNYRLFGRTVRLPNIMGWLIGLATWSKYSHVFVYVGDSSVVEARPKGAGIAPLAEYLPSNIKWSGDVLSDVQRQSVIDAAKSCVGTPYGFLDIIAIGLRTVGLPWRWVENRVLREDRMICSQLVAWCGGQAGLDWRCGRDYDQEVTPADLARRVT